jgi:hypothetical protein
MKKYTYKNKKTGKKIHSDIPLKDKDLVLVAQIKDGMMRSKEINKK